MNCYLWPDSRGHFIAVLAESETKALATVFLRDDADHWLEFCQKSEPMVVLSTDPHAYKASYTFGGFRQVEQAKNEGFEMP
jgi:hypothetical protein